jgi:hypothetical protein
MSEDRPPRKPLTEGFIPVQRGFVPVDMVPRGHVPTPSNPKSGYQPTTGQGGPSGPPPTTGSGVQAPDKSK